MMMKKKKLEEDSYVFSDFSAKLLMLSREDHVFDMTLNSFLSFHFLLYGMDKKVVNGLDY